MIRYVPSRRSARVRLPRAGAPRRAARGRRATSSELPDQGGAARRRFARPGAAAGLRPASPGRRGQRAAGYPRCTRRARRAALVDGDNGLGPVVGSRAMEAGDGPRARRTARVSSASGTAIISAPAAYYVEKAVAAGLHRRWRFRTRRRTWPRSADEGRFLGTNPWRSASPPAREDPLIFDASTSVVARGKIIVAAHDRERHPRRMGDRSRRLSRRPTPSRRWPARCCRSAARRDRRSRSSSTCSAASDGAAFASHLNTLEDLSAVQNVGHVFAAIRTDLFMPADAVPGRAWMRSCGC